MKNHFDIIDIRRALANNLPMYFWNIQAAKADLKASAISETKALPYFFLLQALWLVPLFMQNDTSTFDKYTNAASLLCMMAGIYFGFRANGGSSGKDFFLRYFVLSWVLTVRLLLILATGILLLSFVFLAITKEDKLAVAIFTTMAEIIYTYRLVWHFRSLRDSTT